MILGISGIAGFRGFLAAGSGPEVVAGGSCNTGLSIAAQALTLTPGTCGAVLQRRRHMWSAGLAFLALDGLSRGKLAIHVRRRARRSRMQCAKPSDSRTARGAGHGGQLFAR